MFNTVAFKAVTFKNKELIYKNKFDFERALDNKKASQ
jgi:hypothetical protein